MIQKAILTTTVLLRHNSPRTFAPADEEPRHSYVRWRKSPRPENLQSSPAPGRVGEWTCPTLSQGRPELCRTRSGYARYGNATWIFTGVVYLPETLGGPRRDVFWRNFGPRSIPRIDKTVLIRHLVRVDKKKRGPEFKVLFKGSSNEDKTLFGFICIFVFFSLTISEQEKFI